MTRKGSQSQHSRSRPYREREREKNLTMWRQDTTFRNRFFRTRQLSADIDIDRWNWRKVTNFNKEKERLVVQLSTVFLTCVCLGGSASKLFAVAESKWNTCLPRLGSALPSETFQFFLSSPRHESDNIAAVSANNFAYKNNGLLFFFRREKKNFLSMCDARRYPGFVNPTLAETKNLRPLNKSQKTKIVMVVAE